MRAKHWVPVTIGIPCLNEEDYIEETVRCAFEQDYPSELIEVLVADGGSTDATLRILGEMAAKEPRLRVVPNPGRIQARGMNEIIRQAKGDVLVRFDAHAEYALDYVGTCVRLLDETGAAVVGGAQRAKGVTSFQRALCAALTSPLGVGGAKYRDPEAEGWVDTVWLGAFRREAFETAGLFDPEAITNEDAELNQRIAEAGGRIYLSPEIEAYYFPRDSYRALAKQYYRYGVGRARTLVKHGRFANLRPLVPFLTVVAGATMALTRSRALLPWAMAYLGATAAEAARLTPRDDESMALCWSMFPVLHAGHGVGMAAGLVRYLGSTSERPTEHLQPRVDRERAVA